jgi:fructokinase
MSVPVSLFGEVLFDAFPDGRRVLGGAPFNVAWHLQAFGLRPLLLSRIGSDADGQAILAAMGKWGLQRRGMEQDPGLPTGRVNVTLDGGEPAYEIVKPAAWDAIEGNIAPADDGWLYHGSLALRDQRSRRALAGLLARSHCKVFMDVNLREPWWNRALLDTWMARAHWVKVNEHELVQLSPGSGGVQQRARALLQSAGLDGLVVTRGAAGAMLLTANGEPTGAPAPQRVMVRDTVGAGDAFAAVMLLALNAGWPLRQGLQRALDFAASVCSLRGATSADAAFYAPWREAWSLSGHEHQEHEHV